MLILKNRKLSLFGFAGLFGLFGFRFFFTNDPSDLFAFSFFAFFAFFCIGAINSDVPDERFKENSNKAANVGFIIAACCLFIAGFLVANEASQTLVILVCALGWTASFLGWALAFLLFERA